MSSNTVKYKYGGYSEKPTNDGKVYGTTNDGKSWQTGEQVVDNSYRNGNSNKDNSGIFREDRVTGSGGYDWIDPKKSEYVLVKDGRGGHTSVSRKEAEAEGYDIVGASKGITKWHTDNALRDSSAGSNWVDNGYNSGTVSFRDKDGKMVSVNAAYADKYFDMGYQLDSKSQSIERALQSDYFKTYNNANSAIRDGTYNPNRDYSVGNHVAGKGYEFDGGYINYSPDGGYKPPQEEIKEEVFAPVREEGFNPGEQYSQYTIPEKTNAGSWRVNIDGRNVELTENDYINYMSKLYGI